MSIFDNFESDPFTILTVAELRNRLQAVQHRLAIEAGPINEQITQWQKNSAKARAQLADFYKLALEIESSQYLLRVCQSIGLVQKIRVNRLTSEEIYYLAMSKLQFRSLEPELQN